MVKNIGICLVVLAITFTFSVPSEVDAVVISMKSPPGLLCCSEASVLVDVKGVRPDWENVTVVVGTALNVEVQTACKNPANNGVFPGTAFTQTLTSENIVNPEDITGKGKVTVLLTYPLDQFETSQTCTNPNWIPIPDSAWLQKTTIRIDYFRCNGDPSESDGDICIKEGSNPPEFTYGGAVLATNTYDCTVPATATRNPDGTAPHGVSYDCKLLK